MPTFFKNILYSDSLYSALQPLLIVTFFYGLTPFRAVRSSANIWKIQTSYFGYCTAFITISIYFVCNYMSLLHHRTSTVAVIFQTNVSKLGVVLQMLTGLVGNTVIFFMAIVQKNKLIKTLEILNTVDDVLHGIGVTILYSRMIRYFYYVFILIIILNSLYVGAAYWLLKICGGEVSLFMLVSFLSQHLIFGTTIVMFLCLARLIGRRFLILNQAPIDLFGALQPLFLLSFALGITPFIIPRTSEQSIGFSIFGTLIFIGQIGMLGSCFIYSVAKSETIIGYFFKSDISRFGDIIQKFVAMFGMFLLFGCSFFKKIQFINLVHKVTTVDAKLFDFGVEFRYVRTTMKFTYLFLMATIVVNLVFLTGSLLLLDKVEVNASFTAYYSFFSPHVFISIIVVMFMCCTKTFSHRFDIINKVLVNLSYKLETTRRILTRTTRPTLKCFQAFSMHRIITKNPRDIIQETMESHHLLCEAADIANQYFTYQLLTIISISFLIIVFDAYYVLEAFLGKSKREEKFKTVEFVTFFSSQMVLYLISIISIVEGSSNAMNKSEKTASLVHVLINQSKDFETKEKLKFFSMQLAHQKIKFTAAGLFTIDRSLYFTICGSITTYLIILLQFTASVPSPNTLEGSYNYNNSTIK